MPTNGQREEIEHAMEDAGRTERRASRVALVASFVATALGLAGSVLALFRDLLSETVNVTYVVLLISVGAVVIAVGVAGFRTATKYSRYVRQFDIDQVSDATLRALIIDLNRAQDSVFRSTAGRLGVSGGRE